MSVVKTQDLAAGKKGESVRSLQAFLIAQAKGGAAAALAQNGTTTYFGSLTRAALAEFQKSAGITPAAGYFGAKTRAYINSLAQ
jgi:peptidoglycan hydrolase-like protein with peptidoglycan-binding domain